jgi:formyl-CoA transferase
MADLGAFDPLGMAQSGMLYVTGCEEPLMMHLGILDQATAITVSHAILTALLARERQGIGQEVHVSLYSAALWIQYANLMITSALAREPCIVNDRSRHSPLRNRFRCRDGKWIVGTHHPEEKYWATFCAATGQANLLEDPLFTNAEGGPRNYPKLNTIFDRVFMSKPSEEWVSLLSGKGLMFCVIRRISEVRKDPQAIANGYMIPFDHPIVGRVNIPSYPVQFSISRAGTRCAAPRLGEHTSEVLQKMGYSSEEIDQLREEGIVI